MAYSEKDEDIKRFKDHMLAQLFGNTPRLAYLIYLISNNDKNLQEHPSSETTEGKNTVVSGDGVLQQEGQETPYDRLLDQMLSVSD